MNNHVHNLLSITEPTRAVIDLVKLHLDRDLFRTYDFGNNDPVLVVPGYHCSDQFTKMFREFLTRLGYKVYGWGQGENLARIYQFNAVKNRLFEIYKDHRRPIKIVGYSLGGVYARKLAIDYPDIIDSVITVGTPIYQTQDTSVMRVLTGFAKLRGADSTILEFLKYINFEPEIPIVVLYSKADGIVHWEDTVDKNNRSMCKHICISGSHVGMMHNPIVWRTIRQYYYCNK